MAYSRKRRTSGRAALLMGAAALCFTSLPVAAIGLPTSDFSSIAAA